MSLITKLIELLTIHTIERPEEAPIAYIGHEDEDELRLLEMNYLLSTGGHANTICGMEYHCPCIKTMVSGYNGQKEETTHSGS